MANNIQQIPIPELYREVNHITNHGIAGYHVEKKYQDPLEMMRSRELASGSRRLKKYETKRGNYLDDEANMHKIVPGPGKYKFLDEWPKKTKSLRTEADKKTYIQQLMEREKREKKPAPGHYNIFKSQKQIEVEKKLMASRKIKQNQRTTYLHNAQYEASLTPGVGAYNPRKRVKTEASKLRTKPEDWRKKHEEDKKKKKLPKMPDMTTYNPLPSAYLLFQSNKKQANNKNLLGKLPRFKTDAGGSGLGPGKYLSLQEWRGKEVKIKERHGLESISKGTSKSVYYH